jgi:hypothetical protein
LLRLEDAEATLAARTQKQAPVACGAVVLNDHERAVLGGAVLLRHAHAETAAAVGQYAAHHQAVARLKNMQWIRHAG